MEAGVGGRESLKIVWSTQVSEKGPKLSLSLGPISFPSQKGRKRPDYTLAGFAAYIGGRVADIILAHTEV